MTADPFPPLELQQARAGSPQLPAHPQPGFLVCLFRGWVNARLLDLTAYPTNRVCFLQSESGAGVTGLCGWATRDKRLGACQSCSWGLSAIEPRLVSLPQPPGTRDGVQAPEPGNGRAGVGSEMAGCRDTVRGFGPHRRVQHRPTFCRPAVHSHHTPGTCSRHL